jgi:type I restriction enzyme S subunit
MSFPHYSEYQESGVEWLGKVPSHWALSKFRHCFKESSEKIEEAIIGTMLSVSGYRGIEIKEYDDENRRRTDEDLIGYRVVRPGQLVVNTMWLNYAGLGVSEHEGHVSPAYRSYWIADYFDKGYVHHLLRSDSYVKGYTKYLTGIRPNSLQMSRDDLMAFPVLLPPRSEQALIAVFLDGETAKIDSLVAEQEKLIDLLKEKRQAVITHAVIKGLDPKVPMRASDIDWLGDVPAHWQVRKLSTIISKITNGYVGPTRDILVDDGVRYLQSLHIKGNKIKFDVPYYVTHEWSDRHEKSILQAGDVLVVQTGDIGQVAVVTEEFAGCNCHALIVIAPISDIIKGEWLSWVLFSDYGLHSLRSIETGALHPHLNCGNVRDVYVPLPNLDEQSEIIVFLGESLMKYDSLISEAERLIALLKERRSALIAAAVTGKIDVRGLVMAGAVAAQLETA